MVSMFLVRRAVLVRLILLSCLDCEFFLGFRVHLHTFIPRTARSILLLSRGKYDEKTPRPGIEPGSSA